MLKQDTMPPVERVSPQIYMHIDFQMKMTPQELAVYFQSTIELERTNDRGYGEFLPDRSWRVSNWLKAQTTLHGQTPDAAILQSF
jgi:hypothetical protein